jgi:hypothetical protein
MQGACFPTPQRRKDAGRRCVKLERALQLAFTLMFNLSITIALALIPTLTFIFTLQAGRLYSSTTMPPRPAICHAKVWGLPTHVCRSNLACTNSSSRAPKS